MVTVGIEKVSSSLFLGSSDAPCLSTIHQDFDMGKDWYKGRAGLFVWYGRICPTYSPKLSTQRPE